MLDQMGAKKADRHASTIPLESWRLRVQWHRACQRDHDSAPRIDEDFTEGGNNDTAYPDFAVLARMDGEDAKAGHIGRERDQKRDEALVRFDWGRMGEGTTRLLVSEPKPCQ